MLPRLVTGYSSVEVTLGRYAAYAIVSATAMAWAWRRTRPHLRPSVLGAALLLGWLGNSVYYLLDAHPTFLAEVAVASSA